MDADADAAEVQLLAKDPVQQVYNTATLVPRPDQ
jgi:hypothetical protein